MTTREGCSISLRHNPTVEILLKLDCYEQLKDMVDRGETGWLELESSFGGKLLFRVEDIVEVFYCSPEYCANRDAWNAVNSPD